jgi:lipopolysaccharide export system permease protein
MNRLDRYILKTAGGAFVAVLVVLTSMVWLTTALRRFDLLTAQGQTIWVFFSVTALSLPSLMVVVAPIALFLAIIYTLNKLNSDSELVAMSAAGVGPWHVMRAPLALSIAVAIVSMLVTVDLGARSLRSLRNQVANVNADIVTNVAIPGRFTSISRGLTFHVRERASGGALLGIFIDDSRDRN